MSKNATKENNHRNSYKKALKTLQIELVKIQRHLIEQDVADKLAYMRREFLKKE